MPLEDNFSPEERMRIRRLVLRSGPGAVARLLGQIGGSVAALQQVEQEPLSTTLPVTLPHSTYSWRAPLFDILDEGSSLLIVADLPGVAQVHPYIAGNRLVIETDQNGYSHTCDLPVPVVPHVAGYRFRNGVFSLRLMKKKVL